MTEEFDVAGRLAEGAEAVDRAGTYVWACHELGYQHPDLTTHAAQVRDWYTQEDGLGLLALDADCAALAAAATAADDALARQAALLVELASAWSGAGADAGREFLWRHGQAATAVRDSLRRGADSMTTLRDELWRAVDVKVGAVQDIDDRRLAQRGEWLAAAQTVTTGAGDRATASEIVDQQIKPFVDNDIRSDWMAAMHTAMTSITAAYDTAIARLGAGTDVPFGVPGDLGPSTEMPEEARASVATVPAGVSVAPPTVAVPAVASAPPVAMADPMPPAAAAPTAAAPIATPPAAMEAPPEPPMSSPAGLGGGMPSLGAGTGTGASGFGQQLADLIGSLLGSSEDALPGADELDKADATDEAAQDDPLVDEKNADTEKQDDEKQDDEKQDDEDDQDDEEPDPDAVEESAEPEEQPLPPPEPAPTQAPPPPEPAPPIPAAAAEGQPVERTPCEIAADELPQVGE